jgi:hypothetical protein
MYAGLVAGIVVLAIVSFFLIVVTTCLCMKKPSRKEEIEMSKAEE